MFDYLVVGLGLIGSASLRYLSELSGNVVGIGPCEPADEATHDGIYGAWFDNGRLARQLTTEPVWAELARRALSEFPQLEEKSEVPFYTDSGHIYVSDKPMGAAYWQAIDEMAEKYEVNYRRLDHEARRREFPLLHVPATAEASWEGAPAGFLNPRGLVRAEQTAAAQNGATILNDIVTQLHDRGDHYELATRSGETVKARRVLLATGAYSTSFALTPRQPALRYKGELIVRAEVSEAEAARFGDLPTVIYLIDDPEVADIYLIRPVQYPDGRYYFKMGCNTIVDEHVDGLDGINGWYRDGDSDRFLPVFQRLVGQLFPEMEVLSWLTGRCVITYTTHGLPYVDTLVPGRLYTALGGNGSSAKAADPLGNLAANLMVSDGWNDEMAADPFRLVYEDEIERWPRQHLMRTQ